MDQDKKEEKWHNRVAGVWHSTHTIFDEKGEFLGDSTVGRCVDKKADVKLVNDGDKYKHLLAIDMTWNLQKHFNLEVPYMAFEVEHIDGHRTYVGPDFYGQGQPFDNCLVGNDYCRPWLTHNKVIVHVWPDGKHQTYTSIMYKGWTVVAVINSIMLWTSKDYSGNKELEDQVDNWCAEQKKVGKTTFKHPQHLGGYYTGTLNVHHPSNQLKLGEINVLITYQPISPTRGEFELKIHGLFDFDLKYTKSRVANEHFYEGPDIFGTGFGYGRLLLSTQTLRGRPQRIVAYEFQIDDKFNMSVVWEFHQGLGSQHVCHGFLNWNYGEPPATSIPKSIANAPVTFKRGFFDTPYGQMHYKYGGNGTEWLVLFHQAPRSSDECKELMEIFGNKYKVLAPDILGHGDSDHPNPRISVPQHAETMAQLLNHLGIKKAAVMGQHSGSFVAMELAATYPEKVSFAIFCNLAQFGPEGAAKVHSMKNPELTDDGSHVMARWKAHEGWTDPALNQRWLIDELKSLPNMRDLMYSVADYALQVSSRMPL